jgi:EpsI family protein
MRFSSKFLGTVLLLAATWAAAMATNSRSPEQLRQPLQTIPRQLGDWAGTADRKLDSATEAVLKATSYLSRNYRRDDLAIDFFTAYYALQEAGETMHSPRNCLPGSGWEVWKHQTVKVDLNGETVTLNNYGVQNGNERMVVLYWYQTPDRIIASEYFAKVCLIWDAVLRRCSAACLGRRRL